MKRFYYIITESKPQRTYGGAKKTAQIYTIKKGVLEYCGAAKWHTSSYMGEKSEVFQKLMALGYIPKKYEKSSVCAWRGAGYFDGIVREKYSIEEMPQF
jgi:hypothetical protein